MSDDEKVTAQNEAFFDAVACRDEEGARLIASLSRQSLHGGREYEEDFIYLALLQRWFLGAEVGALAPMLEEWARYAAANPDVRLPVCRALLAGDADAFDEAMTMAIESKLQQWDELRAADLLHPDDASTTCCVSTEVLAWLELADRRGLETQLEYRLAPSLARRFHRVSFPAPDEWQRPSGFSSLTAEGGG